jgi:hypothetical protein
MDFQKFIEWIKQPSTIKALMVLSGLIGVKIDPTKVQEIIEAGLTLYVFIQAFYNQQPRKPTPCPPPGESVK